ncbi:hypothetical protein AAII07_46525, partial [Microvirga sp. 0TCS3.31]
MATIGVDEPVGANSNFLARNTEQISSRPREEVANLWNQAEVRRLAGIGLRSVRDCRGGAD